MYKLMANIVWQVRWWTTYFSLWDSRHTPPQRIYRCHSPAAWRSCRSSCPWPGSRQWPSPPTSCTCHTDCVRGRSGSVEEQEEHHSQKDQLLKVYVKQKFNITLKGTNSSMNKPKSNLFMKFEHKNNKIIPWLCQT